MSAVCQRAPGKAVLTIVGDGPLRAEMEQQIARLNLADVVRLERSDPDCVAALFREADVFVMTSDYEGMPNVILEAMGSGLPVIATAAGGVSEVVLDGETGIVCPLDAEGVFVEGLLRLIEDERLRTSLGRKAQDVAENQFSRRALPRIVLDCYRWALRD
jgi:glycosyltransferase involved in cell wall biosynthesis